MVHQLSDTIRHLQRQASLRANTFGWNAASVRTSPDFWVPCPHCQRAGMDRVTVPVPHDVFECPVCHAIVTDARGVSYDRGVMPPPSVDLPSVDYDAWLIDDPRR